MTARTSTSIVRSAGVNATTQRSLLYAHLSRALVFPSADLHEEVRLGRWADSLVSAAERLPGLDGAAGRDGWTVPPSYDRFQSEYIRLFEVGPRGRVPCPLHSGHYSDRTRVLEELVRFYNFFGLRLATGMMPDHVSVELEFMQFLTGLELEASERDRRSVLRAELDFLRGHLVNWWPLLAAQVKRSRPLPFYRRLVSFVGRFLNSEVCLLETTRGRRGECQDV